MIHKFGRLRKEKLAILEGDYMLHNATEGAACSAMVVQERALHLPPYQTQFGSTCNRIIQAIDSLKDLLLFIFILDRFLISVLVRSSSPCYVYLHCFCFVLCI